MDAKREEIKIPRSHELFDNVAFKKCVIEWKEMLSSDSTRVDVGYPTIAEFTQYYLGGKEIDPRMIERLYKGELKHLKSEYIDALERVFEENKSLPKNSLVFRKYPKKHVSKPDSLLNDIQTKNLIQLHLNSVAFILFDKIKALDYIDNDSDLRRFQENVEEALSKSRMLCNVFESDTLGNINDFFENNFNKIVNETINKGFKEIVCAEMENTKKIKLVKSRVNNIQTNLLKIVDQALNK